MSFLDSNDLLRTQYQEKEEKKSIIFHRWPLDSDAAAAHIGQSQ